MKLLAIVLIVTLVCVLYGWINNSCGYRLTPADLLPFSKSGHGHTFTYNYAALLAIGFAGWWVLRRHGARR